MKNFFKKHNYGLIIIVLAILIISIVYILQKVAPFGDNSLLTIDFFHQYGPMLSELRDRILNGSNLIYSFRMGMGLPFFRNFFNYLSSPFNIILFLFKHQDIVMSYAVIIGLKAVASAYTMALFLKHKFGKNYSLIALALLYGFSAYFTAYYWNIMWLDGMVMLPLIAYGIDELVNKNKILLYVISLAVMLFANYFIGYMLCIFSVLYFIMQMFIETNKFKLKDILKKCLIFAGASLIAGGLCAIFLIPLYMGLKEISATSDVFPMSQYYAFTFKEFAFNHFTGVGSTVLKSGIGKAPNISVGILSIALLLTFLINPKINIKVKIGYLVFLLIIALSFRLGPIDFIWHAFHVPNDLPFRYSFIYSFILVIIMAYSLKNIMNIRPIWIGICYLIMLILITYLKLSNYVNIDNDMVIINYILIAIYFLCYFLTNYFNFKSWSLVFFIFTVSLECVLVINNNWNINHSIKTYYSNYNDVKDSLNYISQNDNGFYRVERLSMLSFNDPSWFGYNGQEAFSSMEYENLAVLQNSLGMPSNEINSFYYKINTPIYNLMFDIKYLLGDIENNNCYKLYYDGEEKVYKFNNNVGLFFGVNDDIKNWNATYENALKNQNELIYRTSGIKDVLEKVKYVDKKIVYEDDEHTIVKYFFPNINNNYYMYLTDSFYADFVIDKNTLYYKNTYDYALNNDDIIIYKYEDYNEKFIISSYNEGKNNIEIYVGFTNYDDIQDEYFQLYVLNNDKYNNVYNYFLDRKLDISSFSESKIIIKSKTKEDMTIYSSIPYDKGWNVYIDGKKENTFKIGNALLGFDLPLGEHEIIIKYKIPYIEISSIISLLSLLSLISWIKLKKN